MTLTDTGFPVKLHETVWWGLAQEGAKAWKDGHGHTGFPVNRSSVSTGGETAG